MHTQGNEKGWKVLFLQSFSALGDVAAQHSRVMETSRLTVSDVEKPTHSELLVCRVKQ